MDLSESGDIPGLAAMLTSIELCSAVMEVSPPAVKSQLLQLLHQGFLIPVLGPALTDSVEKVRSQIVLEDEILIARLFS